MKNYLVVSTKPFIEIEFDRILEDPIFNEETKQYEFLTTVLFEKKIVCNFLGVAQFAYKTSDGNFIYHVFEGF